MQFFNSRRLTGPNLLWEKPGAVLDVEFGKVDPHLAISTWEDYAKQMLDAVGWRQQQTCSLRLSDGASLAISAPLDGLYSACSINEWAWLASRDKLLSDSERANVEEDIERLRKLVNDESNAQLTELIAAAESNQCTALVDPDELSIGMGGSCDTWKITELPDVNSLNWEAYKDVPVALITGTNGKTTSTRLASAIAKAAGLRSGMSSTDGIIVNGELVKKGDYSGPGGARTVLRHADTQFALLETARGGLLRRGLGVTRADAALITNIASDHIGQFGVNNLEELADVKWIVHRALGENGTLVLNADDPLLVARGLKYASSHASSANAAAKITWYSPDPNNKVISEHVKNGGTACAVIDNHLARVNGANSPELIVPVADVPVTHGGKALFNVANALGVIGLMSAMNVPDETIAAGLKTFSDEDNPGRMNIMQINGATVLVDFAHNTHGLDALLAFAKQLKAKRRLILLGHAGDRTDEDIRDLARCTRDIAFDRIIIKTLDKLRRGREKGEIETLLHDQFIVQGVADKTLEASADEMSGLKSALRWAQAGDLLILLVHENKKDALDYLQSLKSKP